MHLILSFGICIALFGFDCFAKTSTTTTEAPVIPTWARPNDLAALWPLSNFYKLRDVSGNWRNAEGFSGSSPSSRPGPFGDPQTSYSSYSNSKDGGVFLAEGKDFSVRELKSFTISLFLRDIPRSGGGFLQFLDADGNTNNDPLRFTFDGDYKLGFNGGGSEKGAVFEDVFWDKIWNYLAITVVNGESDCTVQLFGRFGPKSEPHSAPFLCKALQSSAGGFRVGSTAGRYNNWPMGTYVSCFMFYKTALTADEISQNYASCRAVLNGPPCGTPRLPITSLPAVPVVEAKPGQFPWIASVHYNMGLFEVTCAATILTPYHLLTSPTCFDNDILHPNNFFVYVGNYDYMRLDTYTQKHVVRNAAVHHLSRKKYHAIVLVELETPIDFSNPYVNEACLPTEDMTYALGNDTSFVIGWGLNGIRPSSIGDQRKIRYSPGSMVPSDTCADSWRLDAITKDDPLMCFIGKPDASVPCKGDLGSPLALPVDGKLVQVGFYNNRDEDCTTTKSKLPLFTRIDSGFLSLLKDELAALSPRHD